MKDYLTQFLYRSVPIILLCAGALTTGLVYAKLTSPRLQPVTESSPVGETSTASPLVVISPDPENSPSPSASLRPSRISPTITPSPVRTSITPTLTPIPTSIALSSANGCLVTLFGNQYDVSPLRSTHPGGDIFKCGSDMSSVYQSQHGTNLSRMQSYLITSTNQTAGSSSPAPTGRYEQEDYHNQPDEYEDDD